MKRLLIALFMVCAWGGLGHASEVDQFIGDTKEVIGKHYEVTYSFDFNGDENKEKIGLGSQVVAWRFLAIEPFITYAPNASDNKANLELSFPLRLGRVPVGGGQELRDLFPEAGKVGGWVDRLAGGFYVRWNLTNDGLRAGWQFAFGK